MIKLIEMWGFAWSLRESAWFIVFVSPVQQVRINKVKTIHFVLQEPYGIRCYIISYQNI